MNDCDDDDDVLLDSDVKTNFFICLFFILATFGVWAGVVCVCKLFKL